ncbi:MAG: molybdopterin-guanine dinucleotide biosynthesis protein [Microbacteriaceae bacterium]|nr:molybdopterin-guanine dinucleotide biosynthesis protein [Microbacteriaceae bacterium]HEV7955852.1 NTP transferase domain-containing protein [Marisediminicola sp.]
MLLDAIVLAGGRSSRLSGTPKAALLYRGETLLARTVAAAANAQRVVVVADVAALGLTDDLPDHVLVTREQPPFAGPAAAIGAGMAMLEESDFVLVLACDMPEVGGAVRRLLAALRPEIDGVVAIDERQHPQPLVAVYRTGLLRAELTKRSGALPGLSVRALTSGVRLEPVIVPSGSTDDVDTWTDAARYGITHPPATVSKGTA